MSELQHVTNASLKGRNVKAQASALGGTGPKDNASLAGPQGRHGNCRTDSRRPLFSLFQLPRLAYAETASLGEGRDPLTTRRRFEREAPPFARNAMRRPSVLHVYKDYYPPVLGGVEKSMHWMCRETRSDFHVRVLVASQSRRFVDEVIDGVRVIRVGCWGRALSAPIAPGFGGWLRRLDSDILHFHMPNPTGELAYLLTRPPRGRVVVTYHSDIVRQRATGAVYGPLQQAFLRRARAIMPTSERYLRSSLALQPHRERCRVVPLGLPLEEYEETPESAAFTRKIRERSPGKTRIVFLGLLRYYKGLSFLIEALAGLPPEVCLFIGGEAPDSRIRERRDLERQVREAGLGDRVAFLGRLSDAQAVGLLRAGDVFCLPSHLRSEAFGLSQIEAMACGLPVVSANLDTGVPEVNRDGETGRVVAPGDADALREGLAELIGDPDLRRRLGEAGRRRAQALYSIRILGENLRRIYNSVLPPEVPSD